MGERRNWILLPTNYLQKLLHNNPKNRETDLPAPKKCCNLAVKKSVWYHEWVSLPVMKVLAAK
ncbi:MAG TPA: hypothetical protein DIW30_04125 [Bacteroidales bacterium]|nr:hypothetical protein [Bacteroidales bacterium]